MFIFLKCTLSIKWSYAPPGGSREWLFELRLQVSSARPGQVWQILLIRKQGILFSFGQFITSKDSQRRWQRWHQTKRGQVTASQMRDIQLLSTPLQAASQGFIVCSCTPRRAGRKPLPHQTPEDDEKLSCDSLVGDIGRRVGNGPWQLHTSPSSPQFQEGREAFCRHSNWLWLWAWLLAHAHTCEVVWRLHGAVPIAGWMEGRDKVGDGWQGMGALTTVLNYSLWCYGGFAESQWNNLTWHFFETHKGTDRRCWTLEAGWPIIDWVMTWAVWTGKNDLPWVMRHSGQTMEGEQKVAGGGKTSSASSVLAAPVCRAPTKRRHARADLASRCQRRRSEPFSAH